MSEKNDGLKRCLAEWINKTLVHGVFMEDKEILRGRKEPYIILLCLMRLERNQGSDQENVGNWLFFYNL